MAKRVTFGVNDTGHRLGEAHHNAKLTDAEVEQIRTLHEEGIMGYKRLAKQFGVARTTIKDICTFKERAATPTGYRTEIIEENYRGGILPMADDHPAPIGHAMACHLFTGDLQLLDDEEIYWS